MFLQRLGHRLSQNQGFRPFVQLQRFSTSDDSYKQMRLKELQQTNLYKLCKPSKSIFDFVKEYDGLSSGEKKPEVKEIIAGRVTNRRDASGKLIFYDISDGQHRVQVMASKSNFEKKEENSFSITKNVRVGDIVAIYGHPGKTNLGELSVVADEIQMLAPSYHMIPNALKDPELRFRQRYVDLLVNEEARNCIRIRSHVIRHLRTFLEKRDFVEVETPILSSQAGGAIAKPFVTQSHAFGEAIPLFMRIAPELYLKKLVVGGLPRVFEIGKQFRNEGIDTKHNPEFTTCEYYQAYADYTDAMSFTEDFLSSLFATIAGKTEVRYTDGIRSYDLSLKPPFARIDFLGSIEEHVGALPIMDDPELASKLQKICKKHSVHCSEPQTTSRLLDKLFSKFVEPTLIQPTFVMDHPKILSPLAKSHSTRHGLTERFEFYIAGQELCNAYSELNDPFEQARRFNTQTEFRQHGDDEIPETDEDFCTALEYGMPPTVGWGLGVDRLCMILSNVHSIKDVISFPFMRPPGMGEDEQK